MSIDTHTSLEEFCADYASRLQDVLASSDWSGVAQLAQNMRECWATDGKYFFAAMAVALATPFTSPTTFCMALPSAPGAA